MKDYHDTNVSSSSFLKKHDLPIDALDNKYLKTILNSAIKELEDEF